MKKIRNYISRVLVLCLILTSILFSEGTYAENLSGYSKQKISTNSYKAGIERPEDFLKDKEKAKEWERSEAERVEKALAKPEKEALSEYKKDPVEISKYSKERNYFTADAISNNPLEKKYEDLKSAISKNKIDKPMYVYYFESTDKFAFKGELRGNSQNEISLEKFNEFKTTVQDRLFSQDGFKDISLSEPDKSDNKPTPLFVHLKLPKGTGILPYQNGESVSTLIEQGYSIKVDKTVRVVISGKQYIKVEASLVNSLDFKDRGFEGNEWGMNAYSELGKSLSDTDKATLNDYMSRGYQSINPYLIANGPVNNPNPELDAKIEILDNIMKRYPLPTNLTVYRRVGVAEFGMTIGSPESDFSKTENVEAFKDKWSGKIQKYENFISTSISSKNELMFTSRLIIIRLKLPKGVEGAYVSGLTGGGFPSEYEFILNKGSKYRIDNVSTLKEGTRTKIIIDGTVIL
ncbi:ADP-ribosyltransferase subunit [Clostridioides phage phiSemix9P1]|uniref:ADP-ribosyltransferase n=1 Tax=unclassified Clostridioides TaxID=2635829 RepID=UPI0009C2F1E9|nr:ADP-ribosyltransferase subunit [Clostridioides phage phiSemix9P1]MCC0646161.1 iota toxin protein Ia [Clostridioides sp. ZZV14-6150]MCC0718330.1 iota toxin protein Ia [Clostridioides sp. ZZV14-6105]MCC0723979.1 iota toxin protein Ia [Clostridioides sp. ZZV14-6104]MCC0724817.1 iota toxin protein Ia [Clostridioides sp. ZZV14-6045]MCC0732263.1 iota toxin protein Ia [Clostridioides sp. ZZV14-6048]MCC0736400.1 iota toxin protein Ia [Clostridioides sp. ZZV14-6009]MCC0740191.1 iota toxin protein 